MGVSINKSPLAVNAELERVMAQSEVRFRKGGRLQNRQNQASLSPSYAFQHYVKDVNEKFMYLNMS